jgi:hypothetical protein
MPFLLAHVAGIDGNGVPPLPTHGFAVDVEIAFDRIEIISRQVAVSFLEPF